MPSMLETVASRPTAGASTIGFDANEALVDRTLSTVPLLTDGAATGPAVDGVYQLLQSNVAELKRLGANAEADRLASKIPASYRTYGDLQGAVEEFQSMAGIPKDGDAGRQTWAALLGVKDDQRFAYGRAGLASGAGTANPASLVGTFRQVHGAPAATPAAPTGTSGASSFSQASASRPATQIAPVAPQTAPIRAESVLMTDFAAVARKSPDAADPYMSAALEYGAQHPITAEEASRLMALPFTQMTLGQFGQLAVANPEASARALQAALANRLSAPAERGPAAPAAAPGATPAAPGATGTARAAPAGRGTPVPVPQMLTTLSELTTNALGGEYGELVFGAPDSAKVGDRSPTPPPGADRSGSQASDRLTVWAYVNHEGSGSPENPTVNTWVNVGTYTIDQLRAMTEDGLGAFRARRQNITGRAKELTGVPTGR